MTDKTLRLTGSVIAKADLPDELKGAADDCDVMGYASVETVDRDADIVRVKGISLKNHRPESPVKLLAGHQRLLSSGESPVIGKIVSFRQCTHKGLGVPALAFSATFAKTPLGQHYKTLYDNGDMTDFSIGFRPLKAEPLKDGGLDYVESELIELSSVAIPANAYAGVMRALEETYPDTKQGGWLLPPEIAKAFEEWRDAGFPPIFRDYTENFQQLTDRLDSIESALAVVAKGANQPDSRTGSPDENEDEEVTPTVADLLSAIKALSARK